MKLTRPHRKAIEELLAGRYVDALKRAEKAESRATEEARVRAEQILLAQIGLKDLGKLRRLAQALEEHRTAIGARLGIPKNDAWCIVPDTPEDHIPRDILEKTVPSYVEEQKRVQERKHQVHCELLRCRGQSSENLLLRCETTEDASAELEAFEAAAEELLEEQKEVQ